MKEMKEMKEIITDCPREVKLIIGIFCDDTFVLTADTLKKSEKLLEILEVVPPFSELALQIVKELNQRDLNNIKVSGFFDDV